MATSTNDTGGILADGLTLVRVILAPIIMFVIITRWPGIAGAALASVLFIIAALTDVADDMLGGPETAPNRAFGWFDDIADTVLIMLSLVAMVIAMMRQGELSSAFALPPMFIIPALVIILRDVLVTLLKGRDLVKNGYPETRFGAARTFLTFLAVCTLIAAPWLTNQFGGYQMTGTEQVDLTATRLFWVVGEGLLAVAAVLSVITGFQILTDKSTAANDS